MSKHMPGPLLPPGPLSDAATLVHARPQLKPGSTPEDDTATPTRSARGQHRQTRRVPVCLGVGFESEASTFTGVTSDISEGGLFVATHSLPPVGCEIEVRFSLPAGPELRTRGIVRWLRDTHEPDSAPPGMGVQFSALAEEQRTLIRAFVDQWEPTFFEG
jgi:uncharacterized protein (TIGR02266 family)